MPRLGGLEQSLRQLQGLIGRQAQGFVEQQYAVDGTFDSLGLHV